VPDQVAVICNFWHPDTLTLRAGRQSAWMSNITNDGLTRSCTKSFIRNIAFPRVFFGFLRTRNCTEFS